MTFILPSTTIQGKRAAIVTNYFIFVGSCCALLSYRESMTINLSRFYFLFHMFIIIFCIRYTALETR